MTIKDLWQLLFTRVQSFNKLKSRRADAAQAKTTQPFRNIIVICSKYYNALKKEKQIEKQRIVKENLIIMMLNNFSLQQYNQQMYMKYSHHSPLPSSYFLKYTLQFLKLRYSKPIKALKGNVTMADIKTVYFEYFRDNPEKVAEIEKTEKEYLSQVQG